MLLADTGDRAGPTAPSNLTATSLEYELYRNGFFHVLVTGTGNAFVYERGREPMLM